jgi:hypothetical protein
MIEFYGNLREMISLGTFLNLVKQQVLFSDFPFFNRLNSSLPEDQILCVTNFDDLVSIPFQGEVNAMCWKRTLVGDFSEIVEKVDFDGTMKELDLEELAALSLSPEGERAREILLDDLHTLKELGAAPVLNVIGQYERDEACPFFSTDVYSFHVDRSPLPTDTFLCTYFGASSEIIPNAHAIQKVLLPEFRQELQKMYKGGPDGFDFFLQECFFDLHYQPIAGRTPLRLGNGHLWKLAVDHPDSSVLPCIHRAPKENPGEKRLLLIA